MEVTLNLLRPGEKGVIRRLMSPRPQVRQRLLELGIITGALIELVRTAPMGDPLELKINGYRLSLRRLEAEAIIVRREN
jgi:ferrous iron transport protein A